MGQTITIEEIKTGVDKDIKIFTLDRSLTAMAIKTYSHPNEAKGDRFTDLIAAELFDCGVQEVSIYSNIITAKAKDWGSISGAVEDKITKFFEHY